MCSALHLLISSVHFTFLHFALAHLLYISPLCIALPHHPTLDLTFLHCILLIPSNVHLTFLHCALPFLLIYCTFDFSPLPLFQHYRWMPPLMICPPDKHYLTEFTHLGKHLPTEVSQRAPTLAPPTSIFTMFTNIEGRICIIYFVQMNMNIVCGVCYDVQYLQDRHI